MSFFKSIFNSELFKISSLNSISVLVRIGTGLVTSKLLAIFVGPSGMALVGNLKNFMATLEALATLGFQNGIIKGAAEIIEEKEPFKKFVATLFISLTLVSVVLSLGLFLFVDYFNSYIFGNQTQFKWIIYLLSLTLPWYVASLLFLSILNGLQEFKQVIWVSILGNAISFVCTLILVWQFKVFGALMVSVLAPALLFFVTFYFINKKISFWQLISLNLFEKKILKDLSSYSLMAVFSSVIGPVVFISIRNHVIQNLGINQAGYWETMSRLSTYYMLFISTILTVYFLPKLVVAKDSQETKTIFWSFYKNIIPVFTIGLVGVYFLRFLIVNLLLTKAFLPISDFFFWQLFSDFLKAISLILGYQLLAQKNTTFFIVFEVLSLFFLYFMSVFLISIYGIEGVFIAQALENGFYLTLLVFYFRKSLF